MNIFRNAIRAMLALMVVVFSLSGFAAPPVSKNFSVAIAPLVIKPNVAMDVTASYSNTSPPSSNSTINSTILILPAGSGLTINTVSGSTGTCTVVPQTDGSKQIKCSGFTGVKPLDPPFVVTLNVTAPPPCHLVTWSAQAFAGNSWSGDKFNLVTSSSSLVNQVGCEQFTGSAFCGDTLNLSGDNLAQGRREFYNKDGGTCQLVNYNFTNTVNLDGSALLRWDTQPSAVFSYTVTANPTVVDTTGWPPTAPRPRVAWEFDSTTGLPLYKPYGVACLSSTVPTPYGALYAAVNNTSTSITVDTTTKVIDMPEAPFPLAIGSERMQVTAKASAGGNLYTLTVTRGAGDLGADAASHSAGDFVMSTPLPIDPNAKLPNGTGGFSTLDNPYYQRQAQICIAARGWTAYDQDPVTLRSRVRWWSYIFDVGDGWYSIGGGE